MKKIYISTGMGNTWAPLGPWRKAQVTTCPECDGGRDNIHVGGCASCAPVEENTHPVCQRCDGTGTVNRQPQKEPTT